ncbi:hypothetical protein SAMN06264364_12526 [Quadrisphaera granulorum]|uniref:Hydantoinase/oxoprolinase-like protein n=1 Tax=Quadrisphaera granulorum TaxID=317664 RepID=A0A315ZW38_9ACTN|nr:hypothetical protein [Quadrisphaera granulorum]PWJ49559.1 hypothetical protein BXY45_12526 [Quadrisphaera granulorum]SZE98138.1 hypothetical protein SAMN06264364_12526 [Quadrisphaera granulorum]
MVPTAQPAEGSECYQHTDPSLVGAQLRPDGATAVVVRPAARAGGRAQVLLVERATGPGALERVLTAALSVLAAPATDAVPSRPVSVVLDAGPYLEHLLHHAGSLDPVAVVRVTPRASTDPALARHPSALVEALVSHRWVVPGGHDLLGRELRLLDRDVLADVVETLAGVAPRYVAVVAAGSAGQPAHERTVADAVQAALPGARISAAHDFGGHGSAAREATVVADAALRGAVDVVVDRAEAVLRRRAGRRGAELRLCRGDGGSLSAERARSAPVLVLGGGHGPAVLGAALLAGLDRCRVVLPAVGGGHLVGGVRNGLALVRPLVVGSPPAELVVPTVAVDRARPGVAGDRLPADAGSPVDGQVPDVVADRPLDELACAGAALARPLSWLDEIAAIGSADDLAAVQRTAVQRATALATANGAEPGSADVVEVSAVAVPYSRAGTVRVRVRVGGAGR